MAYKISDDCLACGVCQPECLNEAISEDESSYIIDPNKCTECVGFRTSARCAEVCPVGAPILDPSHKESLQQLLVKWEKLHPGEKPG